MVNESLSLVGIRVRPQEARGPQRSRRARAASAHLRAGWPLKGWRVALAAGVQAVCPLCPGPPVNRRELLPVLLLSVGRHPLLCRGQLLDEPHAPCGL